MTVKIVTDSVADLPSEIAEELGITVVPLNVRFGTDVYRDGIDLTSDEFFSRLEHNEDVPVTSVPSPGSFADAYDALAEEVDEILVITISAKLSGTNEVARQSVGLMKKRCRVEVVDSRLATMALGFVVMEAAKVAQTGAGTDDVLTNVYHNIPRVEMRAAFDTLEYLKRGGRIGKAQSLLGSILNINPIIGLADGEVVPISRERSRDKAIEHLFNFVTSYSKIDGIAVEYATSTHEAKNLVDRLSTRFPDGQIYLSRASPVIGTHTGPGLLLVSVLGDK
ncbi:MAG: DegV family protein [Dehalococcoidales bacterium]|nr:MAG: DegV family protein [Dehalococcoidales bacterium]